jgi:hypothetical protein
MFSIPNHKGNANQNHVKIPLLLEWLSSRLARMWEKKNPTGYWWECKLVQALWKTVWRQLKKLKIELPYDPPTPILGIYPKECKSGYNKDTCTPMFIVVLFTIAELGKQPQSPKTDEWIKKI